MTDRSSRILVAVDASNFEYACIFSAATRWEKAEPMLASATLKDKWHTDQENLPQLLNFDGYRRILSHVVQERLTAMRDIVSRNHESDIDAAKGVDVIFALDGDLSKNFRKRLYPQYKAQRDAERRRFDVRGVRPYIENVIFAELGLETALGYGMVKVEGCECDDIIATLMDIYPDYGTRIVFSADRDFLQLKDVVQYNIWGERIERTVNGAFEGASRSEYLLWKIIRGDLADNIKNVFPKYGDVKSWRLVNDRETLKRMLLEDNAATERFILNKTLIDFRHIPKGMRDRIAAALDEKLSKIAKDDAFTLDGCMVL